MAGSAVAELPAGFTLDAPAASGGSNLPAGFTVDAPARKPSPKPAAAQPAPATPDGGGDWSGTNFHTGRLAKGVTNFAGMLPELATNAANLGIAGYGLARGAITGRPGESPQPIDPARVPGTPSNLQDMLRSMGGLRDTETESTAGRYYGAALEALPAMFAGGPRAPRIQAPPNAATPIRNAVRSEADMLMRSAPPRAATAAASSGMAGELGADIGGEEYRGVASMAPGARSMGYKTAGERATAERKGDAFGKAKDMGIPVPPREMKAVPQEQAIQNLANRHLGQPEGTAITPETLKQYRSAYEPDYKAAFKSPPLVKGLIPSQQFQSEIQRLGDEISGGTTALPQTFKGVKEATRLLGEYGYGQMPPGVKGNVPPRSQPIPTANVQRAIRIMREGASANFAAGGENNVALARAQKGIANALEGLVEQNLARTGQQELMGKFRDARTQMAKSYDIEESLDPSTRKLSGARLSSSMTGGRPLSGELKDLAEVSGQFPGAVKPPRGQDEMFTKKMSPMAVTHPPAMVAHQAGRLWDPITMSRPYQSAVVDPRNKISPEQERMIRMFLAAQAANRGGIPTPPQ